MKKLIAIILSLALVVCVFAVNVSAADVTVPAAGNYNVVGTHNGANGINNGLTDTQFGSGKNAQAIVKLALSAAQSRYAVDITFTGAYTINAAGLTWDVNQLAYVTTDDEPVENQEYTFTVTNYSDKEVKVVAAVEVAAAAGTAGVLAEFDDTLAGNDVTGDSDDHTIAGNANTVDGVANYSNFTATVSSADWAATINQLVGKTTQNEFVLATFTITVSNPNYSQP